MESVEEEDDDCEYTDKPPTLHYDELDNLGTEGLIESRRLKEKI